MQSTNPGNRIRKRLAPESSVGSMPCPSACSPSLPPNWVPNLFFHAWVLTLATSQTDNVSGPLHPLWASELYIQAIDCWPLWHGPVSARICRPKLSLPPFLETIPSTPPALSTQLWKPALSMWLCMDFRSLPAAHKTHVLPLRHHVESPWNFRTQTS